MIDTLLHAARQGASLAHQALADVRHELAVRAALWLLTSGRPLSPDEQAEVIASQKASLRAQLTCGDCGNPATLEALFGGWGNAFARGPYLPRCKPCVDQTREDWADVRPLHRPGA